MMFLFLYVQQECNPFLVNSANKMEFILISSLISVIFIQLLTSMDDIFREYLTAIFILLPLVLLIYFVIEYKRKTFRNTKASEKGVEAIEKVEMDKKNDYLLLTNNEDEL